MALLFAWLFAFGFVQPSHAGVRVSGTADAVVLEIHDASLAEVLAVLQGSFKFQYRSAAALNGTMSGTYSGPLRRVISNLLQDHNFLIRSSQNQLDVVIFGSNTAAQVTAPRAPAVATAPAPAGKPQPLPNPAEPWKECTYDYGNGRIVPVEC